MLRDADLPGDACDGRLGWRRAAEEMSPAALARSGLARELDHERTRGARGELLEETVDGGDVGELVQPLAVDAQLSRRLRAAQHQYGEARGGLRRDLENALDVVRV